MKYVAVSQNIEGILTIYVFNRHTKQAHSYWPTLAEAQEVANDLNKAIKKLAV